MAEKKNDQEGWRERKRRETYQRILDTGLKVSFADGYEETTIDAIAEGAGISRRTFFYYFKSKEEILLAWQSGLPEAFRAVILKESTDQSPIDVVRNAHLKLMADYNVDQAVVIYWIVRSNERLRASNRANYLHVEQAVFEALSELWPQAERRRGLSFVAMASVGTMRLAMDIWAEEGGKKPWAEYIEKGFASLKAELTDA